jgi:glutamyl-tRNA reductase
MAKSDSRLSSLFVTGVTHRAASMSALESLHLTDDETGELTELLLLGLNECVVVSTCNRTEIYGVADRPVHEMCIRALTRFKFADDIVSARDTFSLTGESAARHLFRVAASIDSKIVGDSQILGQLRNAYELAKRRDATGGILNPLFQRAFKLGKRVRTETEIHKGAVSVGLAAVRLAREKCGPLAAKTVLVIGAGKTARLAAEALAKAGIGKLIIANRTRSRAEAIASKLAEKGTNCVETTDLSHLRILLRGCDAVISATAAPEPILNKADFTRQTRPILLIDIAIPRDIAADVVECPKVYLRNLADLNDLVAGNYKNRVAALPLIDRMIEAELGGFTASLKPIHFRSGERFARRGAFAS